MSGHSEERTEVWLIGDDGITVLRLRHRILKYFISHVVSTLGTRDCDQYENKGGGQGR